MKINADKLVRAIRKRYFAGVENKQTVGIVTPIGLVYVLLGNAIYMYIRLEENDLPVIGLPVNSAWRIESSAGAHAAVFETSGYQNERSLADTIINAVYDLVGVYERI